MKSILLAIVMLVAGCACFKPAHRNDPGCAIANQIVDCSETAVQVLLPQFKPVVQALINKATGANGKIDWTQVEQGLIGLGVKDGGCILVSIQNDYLTNKSASPMVGVTATSYSEGYVDYRIRHWPGVKFKFVVDGKTVVR